MPPKRKAAASSKGRVKKIKEEQEPPKDPFQATKEALKSAAPQQKGQRKVDSHCEISAEVRMPLLCQTNRDIFLMHLVIMYPSVKDCFCLIYYNWSLCQLFQGWT